MLQSMTGYGEGVCQEGELYYSAQIRTVNGKSLKTTIKLPDSLSFAEEKLERIIRTSLSRGTVYLAVQLRNAAEKPLVNINPKAASYYINALTEAIGDNTYCRIEAASLLSYPGVVEAYMPEQSAKDAIEQAVCKVVDSAIENLKKFRTQEGQALANDLLTNCNNIRQILDNVAERSPILVDEYRQKLEKRVNDLLQSAKLNVDEQQLIREVAIYADRSDISEEISRLRSHLELFASETQSSESVGRRLDFLCQEMFREANTIGSKASDAKICQWVVDMKCFVDRIKEQVQNVE